MIKINLTITDNSRNGFSQKTVKTENGSLLIEIPRDRQSSFEPQLIHVWHSPDGHKELRLNGISLPYSTYDKLSEIDQGAIVDNKRLGRALEMAQLVQAERDNNRSQSVPSGDGLSRRCKAPTTKKSQRSPDEDDMFNALVKLQSRSEEIFGKKQI
ncbi:transposase [Providencia rettgeri]